ncbi:hypothetical protein [Paraburkholderia phosphatilytica]|uniref:hypothetical protein n=1 Tax=Paraburkholderia phosphatilytica TaxID=2282883 RepID=UPI001F0C690D|nr:hypothetical protein [Paraburkholderia phosphatilytica]
MKSLPPVRAAGPVLPATAATSSAALARYHVRAAAGTLVVLLLCGAGVAAALWLASLFLCLSLHRTPLHATLALWPQAMLAWYDGRLPGQGRRIAGAALCALLVAFGVPGAGLHALFAGANRRRLYGSARFASTAEIRRAGLL